MLFVLFFIIAFFVILVSEKLSSYSDMIHKKGIISGVLVGAFLLAGITSLPEVVTSVASIYIGNPGLAIGNVLGSNAFNIFALCIVDIFFINKRFLNAVDKKYLLLHLFSLGMFILTTLALMNYVNISFGGINLVSILIVIIYFIYLKLLNKIDIALEEESHEEIKLTKKQIITRFIIAAILIVILGIILTIVVDKITVAYPKFSTSIAGALLLAVSTSLPEFVSVFTLVKKNNFNLAIGAIFGSNIFNFLILSTVNVLSIKTDIYQLATDQDILLAIFGIIFTFLSIYTIIRKDIQNKMMYILPSVIIICLYGYYWYLQFN